MTKNCVKDIEAVEFTVSNIKKIIDVIGKVNLVFPAYKVAEAEMKKNYKTFAEAIARINLTGYGDMTPRNRRIVEIYELCSAILEVAEELMQEIKILHKKKNFLKAACIL